MPSIQPVMLNENTLHSYVRIFFQNSQPSLSDFIDISGAVYRYTYKTRLLCIFKYVVIKYGCLHVYEICSINIMYVDIYEHWWVNMRVCVFVCFICNYKA